MEWDKNNIKSFTYLAATGDMRSYRIATEGYIVMVKNTIFIVHTYDKLH